MSIVAGHSDTMLVSEFADLMWDGTTGYSVDWNEKPKNSLWEHFGISKDLKDLPAYVKTAQDFKDLVTTFPYIKTRWDFIRPAIGLQKELRPLVLKLVLPSTERLEIIPKILTLPENDRETFCLDLLEKFNKSENEWLTREFFQEHYEEYWFSSPNIRALCSRQEDPKEFLKSLIAFPHDKREHLCALAAYVSEELNQDVIGTSWFQEAKNNNSVEDLAKWRTAAETSRVAWTELSNPQERWRIIRKASQRTLDPNFLKLVGPLWNIPEEEMKPMIVEGLLDEIHLLGKLDEETQKNIAQRTFSLLPHTDQRIGLMTAVSNLPPDVDVLSLAALVKPKKINSIILNYLSYIPLKDRKKFWDDNIFCFESESFICNSFNNYWRKNEHIKSLLAGLESEKGIAEILIEITKIPPSQLNKLHRPLISLFHAMPTGTQRRLQLLYVINSIPSHERYEFCRIILPLLSHASRSDGNLDEMKIATDIASVPSDERKELADITLSLSQGIASLNERGAVLKAVSSAPTNQRKNIALSASPYFTPLMNGDRRAYLISITSYLSPQTIELIQKMKLPNQPFEFSMEVLEYWFQDPDVRKNIADDLEKYLLSDSDAEKKYKLAKYILDTNELFLGLDMDEPLMKAAELAWSISNPNALNETLNPYRIYRQLKAIVPTENFISLDPIPHSITVNDQQKKAYWNLDYLQEKGTLRPLTVGDLPAVSASIIEDTFTELEHRLANSPEPMKSELKAEIASRSDAEVPTTLKQHRENMLGKPFMRRTLKVGSKETDPIHIQQLQLYSILKVMEQRSNHRDADQCLSEREEMLLKLSESIRECPVGQRGGVSEFYDSLKVDDRVSLIALPKAGPKGILERVVDDVMQKCLSNLFRNDTVLRKYTKTPDEQPVAQTSHQIHYVKNRLARQIGLRDSVQWDANTQVLSEALVLANPAKILQSFIEAFDPQIAIDSLIQESKEWLNKPSGFYVGVQELLENAIGKDLDYSKYLIADKETGEWKLTQLGSVTVLRALGYLHVEDENILP